MEEFPEKPLARVRPFLIESGLKRFSAKYFAGVRSFGKSILLRRNGQADWLLETKSLLRASNSVFRKTLEEPDWAEEVNRNVVNTASGVFAFFDSLPQEYSLVFGRRTRRLA